MNLQGGNKQKKPVPSAGPSKYLEKEEGMISWMKEKIHQNYLSPQDKSKFHQFLEYLGNTLEQKNRSLVSKEIQIAKEESKLKETRDKLLELAAQSPEDADALNLLAKNIEKDLQLEKSRQNFQVYFENIHSKFFYNLSGAFPVLTKNELRHCAYLRLNMSTKEIAELLCISPKSVSMAHYRIRKKLQLEDRANLYLFLKKY